MNPGSRLSALNWADVDPARHPFSAEAVSTFIGARAFSPTFETDIDERLIRRFGLWIAGWRWDRIAGGPVQRWCSNAHTATRHADQFGQRACA